jgi:hypothetical protein
MTEEIAVPYQGATDDIWSVVYPLVKAVIFLKHVRMEYR